MSRVLMSVLKLNDIGMVVAYLNRWAEGGDDEAKFSYS